MRKTLLLLAIVIVVVALLVLVTWMSSREEPGVPLAPVPVKDEVVRPAADLERPAPSREPRADSRVAAGTDASARASSAAVGTKLECTLRVHVVLPPGVEHLPRDLDVRISSEWGVVHDAHAEGDRDLTVRGLHAGTYVIVAKAPGWRRVWKRVTVDPPAPAATRDTPAETHAEIALQRAHRIRVRWRTPAGRPILEGLAETHVPTAPVDSFEDLQAGIDRERDSNAAVSTRTTLRAIATEGIPPRLGPVPDWQSLTDHPLYAIVQRDADGHTTSSASPWLASRAPVEDPNPPLDAFAMLEVDVDGPVHVSVWRDRVRIDTALVASDQDEVVFTTTSEALDVPVAPVTVRVVDDETGEPLDDATVDEVLSGRSNTNARGIARANVALGRATFTIGAPEHDPLVVHRTLEDAAPADLGVARLRRSVGDSDEETLAYVAKFRVRRPDGAPLDGIALELVRLESYDREAGTMETSTVFTRASSRPDGAPDRAPASSVVLNDTPGFVAFAVRKPERFVLRGVDPKLDVEPRLVPPEAFRRSKNVNGSDREDASDVIAGDVVVGAPRVACIRFAEPPARGTKIVIETVDGLPVRVLDVDDFGIVSTWLGARDHRLHLIENGEATPSLRFTVDRDPFALEITR